MGSDDAAGGVFYFETEGDRKLTPFILAEEKHVISDQSMVYYLNKYLTKENGKGNFTFYITFDAIPFRQTGGERNPGIPYLGMSAVKEKLDYLIRNYYIGNHTAHHLYSEDLSEAEFADEVAEFYKIMEDYSIDISKITTLAYSYGIGDIRQERENTIRLFDYKGITISGAMDYNGYFSRPLSSGKVNRFDVPRIGVDNKSYSRIMTLLENVDIFENRRVVLIDGEDYPFGLADLNVNRNEPTYILIRN
jgi:peptidoglycan/xylan/chitin deacetylase (PgdA/CDA1 family)